jgi:hypothetical protein
MQSSADSERRFGYGIEIELLLARLADYEPLSYGELRADDLFALIDELDTTDLGTDGMNTKPLHRGPSHYLVEGYTVTDSDYKPQKLLPKGIEARTPVCESIDETIQIVGELHRRLREALKRHAMVPVVLAHHPTAEDLDAPRNYRRNDYWQWALTVTTTYGPDVNISVPREYELRIKSETLHNRLNYYAPSVVALSLNSPLYRGKLFEVNGAVGKSARTYRRSIWAPLYYIHEEPQLRFEFKGLEMATRAEDYKAYFLCALALLFDENLKTEATDQARIYDLGRIAVEGLEPDFVRERAQAVLSAAERIAEEMEIDRSCLEEMHRRVESREVPADTVIEIFRETADVRETLMRLPVFEEVGEKGRKTKLTAQ